MGRRLEILAPVGGMDCLTPAVRLGADAVYLGAERFSARGRAGNFDRGGLCQAVAYCHVRGVKVYLALNTLVRDDELRDALNLAEFACSLPVDALIVQDVGVAALLRAACPGMRLHASTQMSVHTPMGAQLLHRAGFSRVVLARELSLAEIREIAASGPVELEVFVHGALCMSVSGQCYLSAMLGSRSGNRGWCAQPCRLPFSVPGGTGHDLSLRDCCALGHLSALAEAGVTSAKIEGRMKRPEYVAAATAAYRLAADGQPVPPELMERLEAVFSRTGFTDGYLTGRRGRAMFGVRRREDAATGEVLASLRGMYHDEPRTIPVDWRLSVRRGEPMGLSVSDPQGHTATCQGDVPQDARTVPLTVEKCRDQLEKTGGTPYRSCTFAIDVDDGLSVPLSVLNRLRRDALEGLSRQRAAAPPVAYTTPILPRTGDHEGIDVAMRHSRAHFPDTDIPDVFRRCELVYVPLAADDAQIDRLLERGFPVGVELPRGMFGTEAGVVRRLEQVRRLGVSHAWAGTLGAIAAARDAGMTVHGGFGLNLCNTAALEWVEKLGVADAELSPELTLKQAAALGGTLPRGVMVYGRLPLMLTRNCPAANAPGGCAHCTAPALTDRKNARFPILCSGGCAQIFNSVPTVLTDQARNILHMDFVIFRFSVENSVEKEENFRAFHHGISPKTHFTRGLSERGVE